MLPGSAAIGRWQTSSPGTPAPNGTRTPLTSLVPLPPICGPAAVTNSSHQWLDRGALTSQNKEHRMDALWIEALVPMLVSAGGTMLIFLPQEAAAAASKCDSMTEAVRLRDAEESSRPASDPEEGPAFDGKLERGRLGLRGDASRRCSGESSHPPRNSHPGVT